MTGVSLGYTLQCGLCMDLAEDGKLVHRHERVFCLLSRRRIKPRFILNREKDRALPIKVLKWATGVVITYGAAALLLRGREGLEVGIFAVCLYT